MRDAQSPDVAKIMRGVSTCKMLGAVRSTLINLHGEKTPVSSDGGQAGANSFAANVLIIGKTGVGKSSFINYLYPDAKRTVSAGRPVTGKGIYKSVLELDNGLTVNLYDTWGLEANKADEWKAVIYRGSSAARPVEYP